MSKRTIPAYGSHGVATRAPTLPPLPSLQAPLPVLSIHQARRPPARRVA